jgi:hypothetical protein
MTPDSEITFRVSADDADAASIRRLATSDSEPAPHGPALLAELCGELVAAIGLADGRAVADRRRASGSLLTLLRLRRWETRAIMSVFGA